MQQSQLLLPPSPSSFNPITAYNSVVSFYNQQSPSPTKLIPLSPSLLYSKLHSLHRHSLGKILLILTLLLPLINILPLIIFIKCFLHLKNQMIKVRRNSVMIPNPFANFQKDNQFCDQFGCHSSSMTLSVKELEGFTFNKNVTKGFDDLRVKRVRIYDDQFEGYYYGIRGRWKEMGVWTGVAVGEVVLSTVVLAVLVSR